VVGACVSLGVDDPGELLGRAHDGGVSHATMATAIGLVDAGKRFASSVFGDRCAMRRSLVLVVVGAFAGLLLIAYLVLKLVCWVSSVFFSRRGPTV
jgi:hypothetical protein